jgi:hypothetical protein
MIPTEQAFVTLSAFNYKGENNRQEAYSPFIHANAITVIESIPLLA